MSRKRQPIEQLKIDLKKQMEETASKMTETAKTMLVFANRLTEEAETQDIALELQAHATELTGAARVLLDWHDALFPKPVTEE